MGGYVWRIGVQQESHNGVCECEFFEYLVATDRLFQIESRQSVRTKNGVGTAQRIYLENGCESQRESQIEYVWQRGVFEPTYAV